MPGGTSGGGTGSSLTKATVIVCGVASLVASLLSFLYELLSSHQALPSPSAHNGDPLTFRSQISLASNVRMQLSIDCRETLTENAERITESHFYSDMLSAFCSCMRVKLHSDSF